MTKMIQKQSQHTFLYIIYICYVYYFLSLAMYKFTYTWYHLVSHQFSRSVMSDSVTPRTAARKASLSNINSWSVLKLMSIESVIPSNHLILCRLLLLLPSVFPSTRVFSNESVLHNRWPEYWEFQCQRQSFQWIFRIDFLEDWLVWSPCSPRDSLNSLIQHYIINIKYNSKIILKWSIICKNITILLFIWNWYNIVNQLYFSKNHF